LVASITVDLDNVYIPMRGLDYAGSLTLTITAGQEINLRTDLVDTRSGGLVDLCTAAIAMKRLKRL